eukprot:m.71196 g.71196  ORF g.71196 m.71196 type:complete len:490 (+) comp24324_c0_seq1:153-1622(+)
MPYFPPNRPAASPGLFGPRPPSYAPTASPMRYFASSQPVKTIKKTPTGGNTVPEPQQRLHRKPQPFRQDNEHTPQSRKHSGARVRSSGGHEPQIQRLSRLPLAFGFPSASTSPELADDHQIGSQDNYNQGDEDNTTTTDFESWTIDQFLADSSKAPLGTGMTTVSRKRQISNYPLAEPHPTTIVALDTEEDKHKLETEHDSEELERARMQHMEHILRSIEDTEPLNIRPPITVVPTPPNHTPTTTTTTHRDRQQRMARQHRLIQSQDPKINNVTNLKSQMSSHLHNLEATEATTDSRRLQLSSNILEKAMTTATPDLAKILRIVHKEYTAYLTSPIINNHSLEDVATDLHTQEAKTQSAQLRNSVLSLRQQVAAARTVNEQLQDTITTLLGADPISTRVLVEREKTNRLIERGVASVYTVNHPLELRARKMQTEIVKLQNEIHQHKKFLGETQMVPPQVIKEYEKLIKRAQRSLQSVNIQMRCVEATTS